MTCRRVFSANINKYKFKFKISYFIPYKVLYNGDNYSTTEMF